MNFKCNNKECLIGYYFNKQKQSSGGSTHFHIYIYIYIYVCVCVCVCMYISVANLLVDRFLHNPYIIGQKHIN